MSLGWLDEEIAELRSQNLLRERRAAATEVGPWVVRGGQRALNLCSNDYLSLASRPGLSAPSGAGASRLVGGDLVVHTELEEALAAWLGAEATLLFASGYAANVGAVSALAGVGSVVLSDALNHASLIDGCRLGRARTVVVAHRDLQAFEVELARATEARKLVVTDGYFSMDGDLAPLVGLRALCDRYGAALYVDEAHALGVLGPEGRGACAEVGITPDVRMGTLGKSFGAGGAFIAGSAPLMRWLWNRARSFVFSTGLAPTVAASALAALPLVRDGLRTARLLRNAATFRSALANHGVLVSAASTGPILPVLLGEAEGAVQIAEALLDRGIFVHPIRPPTVPRGTSRLRLTVQSDHPLEALVEAAASIADVLHR